MHTRKCNVVYWCSRSDSSSCMYDAPPALPLDALDSPFIFIHSFNSPREEQAGSRTIFLHSSDRLQEEARRVREARGGGAGRSRPYSFIPLSFKRCFVRPTGGTSRGPSSSRVQRRRSRSRPLRTDPLRTAAGSTHPYLSLGPLWLSAFISRPVLFSFISFPPLTHKMNYVPTDSDRDSDCEEVERPTGGGRWSEGARVPGGAGLFGGVAGAGAGAGNSASTASPLPGVVQPHSFEEDVPFAKWIPTQTFPNAPPLKQTKLPFFPMKPVVKERLPDLKDLVEASKILPPQAVVASTQTPLNAAPHEQTKLPSPSEMLPLTKELAGPANPARVQDSSTERALYSRLGGKSFPFRTKLNSREDQPSFGDMLAAHYQQMGSTTTTQYPFLHGPPHPPSPTHEREFTRHFGKPMPWAAKVKPLDEKASVPPPVASSSAVPDVSVPGNDSMFFPSTPQKATGRTFSPHDARYSIYPTTPKKTIGRTVSPHNSVPYPAYTCPSSNGGGYGVESREDKGCGKRLDVVAERAKMHVDALLEKEKKSQERRNALAAALAARKKHIERLCGEASSPGDVLRAIEAARYAANLSRSRWSPPTKSAPLSLAERMKVPTSNVRQRDNVKDAEAATVGRPTKGAAPVQHPQPVSRETVEMEDIRRLERDVEQVRAVIEEMPAKRKREAEDDDVGAEGPLSRAAKRICRNAPAFLTGAAAAYVSLAYM
ncbi:hypothetical protein EXIGLDRAFT_214372 [Exidia glandulosa HHB12029]|uniref:Uncharacterized protein n=1 Tax=Exidia glandulosa HHB12029 TaxID=1314781 RepID=A0A165MS97_EXIGL|nr:hypothetical protein EXIGLDRAFT_214372 [Exidia glandulosa HHB12029]